MKRHVIVAIAFALTSSLASATPIVWTLSNVTFQDGGTASGSFVFDADAGVACSTASPVCGSFSSVNIVTTPGTALGTATYDFVCGTDVASCNGLQPNSSQVLFLTSSAANQQGLPAIAFFFTTGAGAPAGLTDAGGTISFDPFFGEGAIQEAFCSDASCLVPVGPSRSVASGSIVGAPPSSVPEPSTVALMAVAIALSGAAMRGRRDAIGARS